MTDLLALADRVEQLTGPCRETDRLIFEAVFLEAEIKRRGADSWFCAIDGSSYGFNLDSAPTGQKVAWCGALPNPTASLDAAMTLVPEGDWGGEISWNFGHARIGGYVELNLANPEWMKPGYDYDDPPHAHAACVSSYDDTEDTPELTKPRQIAIAICIAALRARAALEVSRG